MTAPVLVMRLDLLRCLVLALQIVWIGVNEILVKRFKSRIIEIDLLAVRILWIESFAQEEPADPLPDSTSWSCTENRLHSNLDCMFLRDIRRSGSAVADAASGFRDLRIRSKIRRFVELEINYCAPGKINAICKAPVEPNSLRSQPPK